MLPNTLCSKRFYEIERTTQALMQRYLADDRETWEHSRGVNKLALLLADKMGYLKEQEVACLHWGSLLHDIGKSVIPRDILTKNGLLTVTECNVIKSHPLWGHTITNFAGLPKDICDIIRYHHEWFDGSGYPHRLVGEEIPILARVCTVVDAFDAMISDRTYKQGVSLDHAFKELVRCQGTQFDPDIVCNFLELKPRLLAGDCYFKR